MAGLIGTSGGKTLRVMEFRASGTFTVPSGVKTVELFLVGGGGGTASNTYAAGQGGNVVKTKYDVNGKASCAVVIGAGGAAGGSDGGNTSFDGVAIAYGGSGNGIRATDSSGSFGPETGSSTGVVVGVDGFGGNGVTVSYPYAAHPANGAKSLSAGPANTGAGASGGNRAGGSGYARVEWYE
ncbi:glycine-rich domain-containing protein [Noviherbaspirillum sp. Root189]|uniref:glycine-rich domain-containing protein n=1 Tax=Noviherbaspirillum sp. Root189 TaxID=1736487 RepID=UPI00070C219A|nr:hypothetical protein [Noviherbaspirillum sp. Root189]KRB70496.1 hypothetical protein ASE07_07740 [Noviherbaspirillum sp. Root189]